VIDNAFRAEHDPPSSNACSEAEVHVLEVKEHFLVKQSDVEEHLLLNQCTCEAARDKFSEVIVLSFVGFSFTPVPTHTGLIITEVAGRIKKRWVAGC
jgi:hypothetical protein